MSTQLFPLAVWQSGTNENSIPANDNALRVQVLLGPAKGFASAEPVAPVEDDQYVVGTAWGGFEPTNVVIYKGGTWLEFDSFEGWVKSINGALWHVDDGEWVLGGGEGGDAVWGGITGALSAQTDLVAALAAKANTSSLAAIATTGAVGDLQSFPGGTTNFLRADGTFAAPPGGGGGTGDVSGPASAVADRIAVFDGTTGKLIKDGGKTIAQVETAAAAAARTPNVQAVTSAGTVTPTFLNDLVKITTQAAALALANPSGTAVDGWGIVIRVKDNGTARSITYGSQYRAIGVTLPTTTVVGKTLYLAGIWNAEDTMLDIVAVGQQA